MDSRFTSGLEEQLDQVSGALGLLGNCWGRAGGVECMASCEECFEVWRWGLVAFHRCGIIESHSHAVLQRTTSPPCVLLRTAGGEMAWKEVLSGFWDPFTQQLSELGGARAGAALAAFFWPAAAFTCKHRTIQS